MTSIMSRSRRTRGLRHQKPEDNALGPCSPPSITVSAPPSKRPRGRPRNNPLQSEKPRTALAYKISDPAIVSTSKSIIATPSSSSLRDNVVHKLGMKRKLTLSEEVSPTDLQTVCEGCGRRFYHGEKLDETPVIICCKCEKEWHALCMAREGTKSLDVPGQWECCNCSRMMKLQLLQHAYKDNTEAEVTLDRHARDTACETEELDMPHVTDDYGELVDFSQTTLVQAQKAYKEAKGLFNNVLIERRTCRERFYKLKSELERYGNGLEEYRRQFDSDGVWPGDGESDHSISHQLALGISGDRDWRDKTSAKIDLIMAEEGRLTGRLESLRDDVKRKMATRKRLEQQRSMLFTCLETSCREVEKLRSKVMIDFIEDSLADSDSSSESTMEDSVTEDISPNGIARGSERPADEANQQHMMENSRSKYEREQMQALSRISEATEEFELISTEEFELPQIALRTEAIQILQELPQTPEPAKAPKQSDIANGTSLQETLPRPSNITIHIPSSDLGEGHSQRQNVSLATSLSKEPDQSCTPENSRRIQDPHTPTFVSIPEDLAPSSKALDRSNSSEPSSISLMPKDTTIITGDCNAEESHRHCSVDGMALPAEAVSEAGTRNHFVTGWIPSSSFQQRIRSLLGNSEDKTEIPMRTGVIKRGDLRTLVPDARYLLTDAIINKYLECLTQHTNAPRETDIPDSRSKITMIGSTDRISLGLLKSLASFFAIYIPIKIPNNHWILAVLYPGSFGQRGHSEVYDSHEYWTNNIMTADAVSYFLKSRLGNEYSPGDWTQSAQQRSRPQRSDADSGLYVLANAKSIALNLGMVDLDSRARIISLRWQFAEELLTQSIVRAY